MKKDYSQEDYLCSYDKCPIHKIYTCDCDNIKNQHYITCKFINYYKESSQIFKISNGRIEFIRQNDNQMKFVM